MSDEALEKAWHLIKCPMDGNRPRERRGKCSRPDCSANKTWDSCRMFRLNYAFECPNFDYTE